MQIQIDKLIRAKRRSIALIVERDGSLTVRAPKRAAMRDIHAFIAEKADWILRSREKMKAVVPSPKKQYTDGEKFLYLGDEYELSIVPPQRPALKFDGGFILGSSAQARGENAFIRWYKERAAQMLTERVRHYSALHGFEPKQVKINSAKTRWGSCTSTGTINFTWRLVMAPPDVIDYVVLHELAHLRVKNHSPRFWKLVESLCPDFKRHRKWLRVHGERLSLRNRRGDPSTSGGTLFRKKGSPLRRKICNQQGDPCLRYEVIKESDGSPLRHYTGEQSCFPNP